jgi:DGQHR domain-containing protein
MSMNAIPQGLSMAALKGRQGNRTMYQVLVENSVLNNFFTVNMDPPAEKSQRQMDPKHASAIAQYIEQNPDDYVLGTVIYAVDTECQFTATDLDPRLGVLTIPFGTNMRSLDGQHRRQGLNEAIAVDGELGSDHTAVLIYVEPDLNKRRQMFSDMNATPKVVAKALNVAFDSRDPFARVAMDLAEKHPLLAGHVDFAARQISGSNDNWYTVGAVYDALKRLQVGPSGRVRNASQWTEAAIRERGVEFFDLLNGARDEYRRVRDGEDVAKLRAKSILFSSTTLRALAGAVFDALGTDNTPPTATGFTEQLSTIDFAPSASIWRKSGFVSPGKTTPNARNQEVLAATKAITAVLTGRA